ncbi:MAG: putative potassium/hydrogen antiporter [Geminicoccaceae bacterium]|nr:putative potassium/hydrogen antiporter [Geminicoccaceae bacterium]
MPHDTALIATVAGGLALAFLLGLLAVRLRLPPILGYLLAGVAVGPFTPGFVADLGLASQLAEIGVILLMFGVGLHFSISDLLAVRKIAVPGAIAQIAVATGLGTLLAWFWGWGWASGLVFGLSLSVASTVVLLRALEDVGALESSDGRIAVGWLIVEDLVTVLALVLLPLFAELVGATPPGPVGEGPSHAPDAAGSVLVTLGVTLAKVVAFVAIMLVVGRRAIPWLLGRVANTGSRELFTLAVLAVALGIAAGAAALFDVSFALGAFFAGVVVSESDFSHEAATSALPLRDAFAVLFFVSVGMLFDPGILVREPLAVLAVVAIVLIGKSLAALAIVLAFRYPLHTALRISASLAQIGEFSFILAALAVSLGLLLPEAQSLIVAGALLSITLNPFVFRSVEPLGRWLRSHSTLAEALERPAGDIAQSPPGVSTAALHDHVVVVGHGRVGGPIAEELARHSVRHVIVEASRDVAERLREHGLPVIYGDATRPEVLEDAGVSQALVGERELAVSLTRAALRRFGVAHDMEQVAQRTLHGASTT